MCAGAGSGPDQLVAIVTTTDDGGGSSARLTSPVPAHLAAAYAERGSAPIDVTPKDLAALQNLGEQALGAPLACDGPLGRIRHHPGRLAAAVTACAQFDQHVTG